MSQIEKRYQGIYGEYTINSKDKEEVRLYRFSLLLTSLSFFLFISQWIFINQLFIWIWLVLFITGIGGSLKWIHIYMRSLHKLLIVFWIMGSLGFCLLFFRLGTENFASFLANNPIWLFAIGPLFATLTGIGFKEFFCFRRPEAIGISLLLPISLIGFLTQLIGGPITLALLYFASMLSIILALRKFGTNPSLDIGDKSVFQQMGS